MFIAFCCLRYVGSAASLRKVSWRGVWIPWLSKSQFWKMQLNAPMTSCTWWHFLQCNMTLRSSFTFYLLNLVTFLSRRQDNVQQLVLCGSLHLNFYLLKYVNVALIRAWVGTKSHTQHLSHFSCYCNNNFCCFYSLRRYSQRLSNISIWSNILSNILYALRSQ